jgi:hypothetical protein
VSRVCWLTGRLTIGAGLALVVSLVFGLAAWAGAATQHSGIGLWQMIRAGSNIAPPALCVLGLGTLVYGLWPRLATTVGYGLVAWSFLVQLIGAIVTTNRFLLDTSVLPHVTPAPAANPNWTSVGWLVALGLTAATVGIAAFSAATCPAHGSTRTDDSPNRPDRGALGLRARSASQRTRCIDGSCATRSITDTLNHPPPGSRSGCAHNQCFGGVELRGLEPRTCCLQSTPTENEDQR